MLDLLEILEHVDPAKLDYQQWVNVGMALKDEGYSPADWDKWSSRDAARYHPGDCEKKWRSFNGSASPVTGGTIFQYAKEQGFVPSVSGRTFDWNDEIIAEEEFVISRSTEGIKLSEPVDFHPGKEIIRYLETLFEAAENVGYVVKSFADKNGKIKPAGVGNFDRTAGQLIEELNKHDDDIGAVLGDYNPEAGAWIRINPLDGKGVKNENVTDFRYVLVESDNMTLEEQNALIRELELPVAVLVYSGGKSLHAIVKIDAANYDEYRRRVDYLFSICRKNGLEIDRQCRNPSRLSRMPGVMRNGKKQYIIDTDIGRDSFTDWQEWIESINDDMPEIENLSDVWDNPPELSPPLIDGVLRQGHKMLLAGPSKAGKSYALIELCIAIAEGGKWLDFQCAQGKVFYVNLELDHASRIHRFKEVYKTLGYEPKHIKNIDAWDLRGKTVPMDKLAPRLIRRAKKNNYIAIIIDPIYKVITGDENSADQMAKFCNQFDKICAELGCAVIYCHHHSKGSQGGKRSMDRASGSGVFARDPDALLDLTELEVTDGARTAEENKLVCRIILDWITRFKPDFKDEASQDDLLSPVQMRRHAAALLSENSLKLMHSDIENGKSVLSRRTAWRIEGTLREFAGFKPINCWFDYPVHKFDESGILSDLKPEDDKKPWEKARDSRKKNAEEKRLNTTEAFIDAYNSLCIDNSLPTMKELVTLLGKPDSTVRRWAKNAGYKVDETSGKVAPEHDTTN